ncbi:Spy/CpxP family protein refolding chaperone [Microbulbifer celer]|uniref:Spy/CpxP family protein refolding chaperone n=2 Tax=Microbulbifer TaxID=48073 RepID=A0ABW3U756_9GAMM|nr:Spy/CpxP family protein refolding chaperone [Microbulbifer celer]UFN58380.1 Spy/CpxP family protein refolding chaperone [Microbulbifer celer]
MFEHIAEKLDLTEGQKAQLKANRDASKEAYKARRQESRELRKELHEAVRSGADQATLDSLGTRIGALAVQRAQDMEQQRSQFEAILTDEQKATLNEMKAERMERHQKRKQRWRDRADSDE